MAAPAIFVAGHCWLLRAAPREFFGTRSNQERVPPRGQKQIRTPRSTLRYQKMGQADPCLVMGEGG